jgi:hypothetical protein
MKLGTQANFLADCLNQIYFPLPENPDEIFRLTAQLLEFPAMVNSSNFRQSMSFKFDIEQMLELAVDKNSTSFETLSKALEIITDALNRAAVPLLPSEWECLNNALHAIFFNGNRPVLQSTKDRYVLAAIDLIYWNIVTDQRELLENWISLIGKVQITYLLTIRLHYLTKEWTFPPKSLRLKSLRKTLWTYPNKHKIYGPLYTYTYTYTLLYHCYTSSISHVGSLLEPTWLLHQNAPFGLFKTDSLMNRYDLLISNIPGNAAFF